jgi:hypothetical protein
MNEQQRQVVIDVVLGRAAERALTASLGFDPATQPERALALLDEAARSGNADDVECALHVVGRCALDVDMVPRILHLLALPWHRQHEDLIGWLQQLRDPRAVDALHAAALVDHEYLDHDEFFGVARKCTWALADIGTPEALSKLRLLAASSNPLIAGYAQKRVDAWDAEAPRKGPQGTSRRPPGRPAGS